MWKATKCSSIPNCVMKMAKTLLIGHIFRATHTLKYYLKKCANMQMLIIKKPGKTDYTNPSAWRPIVLSDGLAKLLNACHTEDILTKCEQLNLLPDNHFGGHPGHSTTDSVHLLIKTIKDAWRKEEVALTLFLDVKGAFPSVHVDRLIHNMRKRGVPKQYTNWMRRRLENRTTTLTFDSYSTQEFQVTNGLDQGDPFSVICYIIYNADILSIVDSKTEHGLLFIDDAAIIATGKTFEIMHNKLET